MGSICLQDQGRLTQVRQHFMELTYLSQQWQDQTEPPELAILMASSEVDQKFLGHFATITRHANSFLSSMLYKILGLSVILSKKLLRARKLRRLDPTRETKSLQLYHHILWLSREGLVVVEQYVLPMVTDYVELKVLLYKLQASFYHIFVLFHNQPAIHHQSGIQSVPPSTSNVNLPSNGTTAVVSNGKQLSTPGMSPDTNRGSITVSPPPEVYVKGGPVGGGGGSRRGTQPPPGFGYSQPPKVAASFILPSLDYTPTATACFTYVSSLADQLLPGSHPVRLSVKLEHSAYLYDCLHDTDSCRRLAKKAIADVYNAQEGMDDESFEDATELVGILGKMVKRGGKTSSAGGSSSAGARGERSRSEGSRSTPTRVGGGSSSSGREGAPITPRQRYPQSSSSQQQQQKRTGTTTRGTPTKTVPAPAAAAAHQSFSGPAMVNPI